MFGKLPRKFTINVELGEVVEQSSKAVVGSFVTTIGLILELDLVFSIDSIIPVVGMTDHISIMVIGMTLIADGLGVRVPKGYIYTAMSFSTSFVQWCDQSI